MDTVEVKDMSECPSGDNLCVVRAFESEIIIVPVLLIAASCIVGGCILWMTCRQKKGTRPPDFTETGRQILELRPSNAASCGQAPSDPELRPWQIPADRLVGGLRWIARGRYGDIFLCRLAPEGPGKEKAVVVKELQESASPGLAELFLSRIRFQAALGHHPHLVRMEGCWTQQGTARLVMEALEPGNLLHFLWQCRKDMVTMEATPYDLTEKQVYSIAEQVASALEFLHANGLIHGNVGARNILLGENLTAKLCGLHVPFKIQTTGTPPADRGAPQKWQSPESLMKQTLTGKTDVWSFGILLFEMITLGAPPYGDLPPSSVLPFLQRGRRISQPATCRSSLLMRQCWDWRPGLRPSLPELRRRLQANGRAADDRLVLRVPHRIQPEAYALVAGMQAPAWGQDYTVF
ncbi:tyrosine-protein kinase STYK1-like isoform X2 [Mobula hypostoma]|uniref:tyrosine-protein kinase STYK1-like isoform X2 n=1 Tax=Mobula hypostoma TaxID=723540 RepID=UPI002FC388DF